MGIFGWDYPPGCHSVPGDEETPCAVCGKDCEDCICPECDVCGQQGDPACYVNSTQKPAIPNVKYNGHGLVRTALQIVSLMDAEEKWAEAAAEDFRYHQHHGEEV